MIRKTKRWTDVLVPEFLDILGVTKCLMKSFIQFFGPNLLDPILHFSQKTPGPDFQLL
ncbi:MAG: hypothetical protein CM1200mP10_18360 [Candidatus Neomarinimicrobiota bacterium]|nr:MAG: hypothetical protein CM1200mP10_18360 [Candidatus Neomarinimicrobiota bacterium]